MFEFIITGVFSTKHNLDDIEIYGDFDENEGDVFEFKIDEIELI